MPDHKEENYLIDVYEKIQRIKEKMDQVSFEDFKHNQDLQEIRSSDFFGSCKQHHSHLNS